MGAAAPADGDPEDPAAAGGRGAEPGLQALGHGGHQTARPGEPVPPPGGAADRRHQASGPGQCAPFLASRVVRGRVPIFLENLSVLESLFFSPIPLIYDTLSLSLFGGAGGCLWCLSLSLSLSCVKLFFFFFLFSPV